MYKKELSTKQKGIAKLSGNPKRMDASDFKKLREMKSKNTKLIKKIKKPIKKV